MRPAKIALLLADLHNEADKAQDTGVNPHVVEDVLKVGASVTCAYLDDAMRAVTCADVLVRLCNICRCLRQDEIVFDDMT